MNLVTRAWQRRSSRMPYLVSDTALSIFSTWLVMKNRLANYGRRVTRRKPLTRVTSFSTPCPKTVVIPQRERSFHRTTSRDRTYLIYLLLPRASPTNPANLPRQTVRAPFTPRTRTLGKFVLPGERRRRE